MFAFLFAGLIVAAQTPTDSKAPLVVALGDSITEGYGVSRDSAYPALLEKDLKIRVQNAGISGSTSASAPSRMKWILKSHPKIVILALGANDMLRGFAAAEIEKNLGEAVALAVNEKVSVILCGVPVPSNYGKKYAAEVGSVYTRLAKKYHVTLVPSILKGVAARPNLNQQDGIHPNEKGHAVIAANLEPVLRKLL